METKIKVKNGRDRETAGTTLYYHRESDPVEGWGIFSGDGLWEAFPWLGTSDMDEDQRIFRSDWDSGGLARPEASSGHAYCSYSCSRSSKS